MNDQGLGDWLAQIEKTSMLNEAEHLLFAVLEAVSSAEFYPELFGGPQNDIQVRAGLQSWDTMCSSLFGSKLVKTDNSRKRHMW
jgi:hypothetical protein